MAVRKYTVMVNDWTRVLAWTDTVPAQVKKSQTYNRGDVVELDDENEQDASDIARLTVEPRAALRLVEDEPVDFAAEARAFAVAGERLAALSSPTGVLPGDNRDYPEGQRVDAAGSAVGAGGTDPEPQGFTGEAGQAPWNDEEEWSYSDLQQQARARGLSAGGSRTDIVVRLQEFDRTQGSQLSRDVVEGNLSDGE